MLEITLMAVPIVSTQAPNSLVEHFDVMWIVILAAMAIIVWFATKTFNKFEANQEEIFKRLRATETSMAHLEGEHEVHCSQVILVLNELIEVLKEVRRHDAA